MDKKETNSENETLYMSKNPDDVFAFYSKFDTTKKLLEYSRRRPYNKHNIVEVNGDKRVIAVIPCKDANGKYAKNFRKIFSGFHIVMVESGVDPLFNYAHNTNVGVERALSYSPKWIIVANDDLYEIDDPKAFRKKLLEIDDNEVDAVWINPEPEQHHCHYVHLVKIRPALSLLRALQGPFKRKFNSTLRKFDVDYVLLYGQFKWYYSLFLKNEKRFLDTEDFFVLSGKFVSKTFNKGKIYDEIFITCAEDAWLSMMLTEARSTYIDFKIGSIIGGTIGLSDVGDARGIMGRVFFDYKFKKSGGLHYLQQRAEK